MRDKRWAHTWKEHDAHGHNEYAVAPHHNVVYAIVATSRGIEVHHTRHADKADEVTRLPGANTDANI